MSAIPRCRPAHQRLAPPRRSRPREATLREPTAPHRVPGPLHRETIVVSDRRQTRLQAYEDLRRERPASFNNPSGAPIEIIFDADVQRQASDESAKLLAERGLPPDNGDVGVVYADQYIRLVKDAVRFASGRLGTYIRIMAASDGVPAVVVPILSDSRLALVHHFRHSSREWHWEFPRGFA